MKCEGHLGWASQYLYEWEFEALVDQEPSPQSNIALMQAVLLWEPERDVNCTKNAMGHDCTYCTTSRWFIFLITSATSSLLSDTTCQASQGPSILLAALSNSDRSVYWPWLIVFWLSGRGQGRLLCILCSTNFQNYIQHGVSRYLNNYCFLVSMLLEMQMCVCMQVICICMLARLASHETVTSLYIKHD